TVADAPHRLKPDGIGRVFLDFSPQPVDLHIDSAFADIRVAADQLMPGHRLARAFREDRHDLALAFGQFQQLAGPLQLATGDLESVRTEDKLLQLRRVWMASPAE